MAVAVDVGQGGEDLEVGPPARASTVELPRLTSPTPSDEFASEYCMPALSQRALRRQVPAVSALSRPVITKHLVKVAREFGATTVAHGCTGAGVDQVRFEASPSLRWPST